MDEDCFEAGSNFQLNGRATIHNGGIDRISELPNEILFLVLSLLPMRKAASTTVLSTRWLDLWKQIPNLKFNLKSDRISQLPDQILLAVFSFLTLSEAVATSALSSRWLDLWKHNPYLDFDSDYIYQDEDIVNSVIESHKAPSLKLFRVCFPGSNSAKSTVTKWLEFVFSRQVESLVFDFVMVGRSVRVVLEESLRETRIICVAPQTLPFCQSLKTLVLRSLIVGGGDVKVFLSNCPLLEQLTMIDAAFTSNINVCGPNLLLKHLDIRVCRGAVILRVSAPNLTSFTFSNTIGKLVFEYVPKLVEADLTFVSSEFVAQHVAVISQLQILKMFFSHSKKLSTATFPHMPNLKKLFLNGFRNTHYSLVPLLSALIWKSPRLEEFTFKFWEVGNPSTLMEDDITRSPQQHLKVFELQADSDRTDHLVEVVTFVSDNCVALRQIIVCLPDRDRAGNRADRDDLKQQLQGKVCSQIQLRFDSPI